MTERTQFKAYITKYALTSGITEETVEDCFDISESMVKSAQNELQYFHNGDWHRSLDDAIAKAEDMRKRKISSLKASLAKFEKMSFAK